MPVRPPSGAAPASARSERGAVAVEFALVFPILVMLLLGITTAGIAYSHAVGLSNATREGARFGATADACGGLPTSTPCSTTLPNAATWATDVISRVRSTQYDDETAVAQSHTSVCVQLWKKTGTGTGTALSGWTCSKGGDEGPTINTTTGAPSVPAETPNGACVVRVIAARHFTINAVLLSWTRSSIAKSVARYERTDRVGQCA